MALWYTFEVFISDGKDRRSIIVQTTNFGMAEKMVLCGVDSPGHPWLSNDEQIVEIRRDY